MADASEGNITHVKIVAEETKRARSKASQEIRKASTEIRKTLQKSLAGISSDIQRDLNDAISDMALFADDIVRDLDSGAITRKKQLSEKRKKLTSAYAAGETKVKFIESRKGKKETIYVPVEDLEIRTAIQGVILDHIKDLDLRNKETTLSQLKAILSKINEGGDSAEYDRAVVSQLREKIRSIRGNLLQELKSAPAGNQALSQISQVAKETVKAVTDQVADTVVAAAKEVKSSAKTAELSPGLKRIQDAQDAYDAIVEEIHSLQAGATESQLAVAAGKKKKALAALQKARELQQQEDESNVTATLTEAINKKSSEQNAKAEELRRQREELKAKRAEAQVEENLPLVARKGTRTGVPKVVEKIAEDMESGQFALSSKAIEAIDDALMNFAYTISDAATNINASVINATEEMMFIITEEIRKNVTSKFRKIGSQIDELFGGTKGVAGIGEKLDKIHNTLLMISQGVRPLEEISGSTGTPGTPNMAYLNQMLGLASAEKVAGSEGGFLAPKKYVDFLKFGMGGVVPGTGSRDTVPAMLTPGEVVFNPRMLQKGTTDLILKDFIEGMRVIRENDLSVPVEHLSKKYGPISSRLSMIHRDETISDSIRMLDATFFNEGLKMFALSSDTGKGYHRLGYPQAGISYSAMPSRSESKFAIETENLFPKGSLFMYTSFLSSLKKGGGIGKNLLAMGAIDLIKRFGSGLKHIELSSVPTVNAVASYLGMGFRPIGEQRPIFSEGSWKPGLIPFGMNIGDLLSSQRLHGSVQDYLQSMVPGFSPEQHQINPAIMRAFESAQFPYTIVEGGKQFKFAKEGTPVSSMLQNISKVKNYLATGGPLKLGQSAVVGEKGPELIVPSNRGTGFEVVPNNIVRGLRFLQRGTLESQYEEQAYQAFVNEDIAGIIGFEIGKSVSDALLEVLPPEYKSAAGGMSRTTSMALNDIIAGKSVLNNPSLTASQERQVAYGPEAKAVDMWKQGARRMITGSLIYLHAGRVLASASEVYAGSQTIFSKGLSVLLNAVFLPFIPIAQQLMYSFISIAYPVRQVTTGMMKWLSANPMVALSIGIAGLVGAVTYAMYQLHNLSKSIQLTVESINRLAGAQARPSMFQRVRGLFSRRQGETPLTMASGGKVPGIGNSDSVLALLTPGEIVLNKDTVSRLPRFADGGMAGIGDFFLSAASGFSSMTASAVSGILTNPAFQGIFAGLRIVSSTLGAVMAPIAAVGGAIGGILAAGSGIASKLGTIMNNGNAMVADAVINSGRAQRNLLSLLNIEVLAIVGGIIALIAAVGEVKGTSQIPLDLVKIGQGLLTDLIKGWKSFIDELLKSAKTFIVDLIEKLVGKESFLGKFIEKLIGKEGGLIPALMEKLFGKESFLGKFIDRLIGKESFLGKLFEKIIGKESFIGKLIESLLGKEGGNFLSNLMKAIIEKAGPLGGKAVEYGSKALGIAKGGLTKVTDLVGGAHIGLKGTLAYIAADLLGGVGAQYFGGQAAEEGYTGGMEGFRSDLAKGSPTTTGVFGSELLMNFFPKLWPALSAFNLIGQYQYGKEKGEGRLPEGMTYGEYKDYRINVTAENISSVLKGTLDTMTTAYNDIAKTVTSWVESGKTALTDIWTGLTDWWNSLLSSIGTTFTDAWNGFVSSIASFFTIENITKLITGTGSEVATTATNTAVTAYKTITSALPRLASGGLVTSEGLAILDPAEVVTPLSSFSSIVNQTSKQSDSGAKVTNHNTFVIQREDDYLLFQRFKQMMADDDRRYTA